MVCPRFFYPFEIRAWLAPEAVAEAKTLEEVSIPLKSGHGWHHEADSYFDAYLSLNPFEIRAWLAQSFRLGFGEVYRSQSL